MGWHEAESEVQVRQKMIAELDTALHGETVARDQAPEQVWYDLLGKVRMFADTVTLRKMELQKDNIARLTEDWMRQKERIKELGADWDQVVKQRDDLRAKVEDLYKEIGEMGDSIASATDQLVEAGNRYADLLHDNSKLEAKVKEFVAENIDLRNTIIQRDAEIKKVEVECYRLVQANTKLKQDLEYAEVRLKQFEEATANRGSGSLETDIAASLNYWSADTDLNTPDFILADYLIRQLYSLKAMRKAVTKWQGE